MTRTCCLGSKRSHTDWCTARERDRLRSRLEGRYEVVQSLSLLFALSLVSPQLFSTACSCYLVRNSACNMATPSSDTIRSNASPNFQLNQVSTENTSTSTLTFPLPLLLHHSTLMFALHLSSVTLLNDLLIFTPFPHPNPSHRCFHSVLVTSTAFPFTPHDSPPFTSPRSLTA